MSFPSQLALTAERVAGLNASMRPLVWALLGACRYRLGIYLTVTRGRVTHEEQAEVYAKGRTKAGEPCTHDGVRREPGDCPRHPLGATVTRASPGQSEHEYGDAADVAKLHADGRVTWDDVPWEAVGSIGEEVGLRWGGRWQEADRPHFEAPEAPLVRPPLGGAEA